MLSRKARKRFPARDKKPLTAFLNFGQSGSIDFTGDTLDNSRKFRSFNVIDDYNHERPRDALVELAPEKYRQMNPLLLMINKASNFELY